jgi:hypothetical protein
LRIDAFAGVVATVISILSGSLSIYTETIRKTQESRQALYNEFTKYILDINAANQKLAALNVGTGENSLGALTGIQYAKSMSIASAGALLPRIQTMANPLQLELLANEAEQIGDRFGVRRSAAQLPAE